MNSPSRKNAPATRGRPFQKGNPGRPVGARHKVSKAVEALLEGDAEKITRKAIEMALDGDRIALRLCLERIAPPRKSRPVVLPLPEMKTMDDVIAAQAVVASELASGELATDEAADIAKVLEVIALSMKAREFEQRLAALEVRET